MYKVYEGNIKPEPNTIFVFGSNTEGRHGADAAKVAVTQFNAIYGQSEGLQGNAYALPTTELRPNFQGVLRQSLDVVRIITSIQRLYLTCERFPDSQFKVAYRSQPDEVTLCGYSGEQLMSFFKAAKGKFDYPDNLWFSKEWADSKLL